MRRILLILLVVLPLVLAARTTPPEIEQPTTQPARNFTISGANLTITPGGDHSYLRFEGGIRCVTTTMELSADVLELDLQTTEVTGGTELKLPQTDMPAERVVEDPGAIVRSMAAEMEVPSARFSANAIRRVGAAGHVRIKSDQLNLTTEELVSTDGGRSWAASGRSTLSRSDELGTSYELSADYILYDMEAQKALARGEIRGKYSTAGGETALIEAERVELDVAASVIRASEYLQVAYKGYTLRTGSLTADIGGQLVSAGDAPRLEQLELGLSATAAGIEVDLARMVLTATGGIRVADSKRGIVLTAGELTAYLDEDKLIAKGKPHLEQGTSTFDGELITVTQQDGKTVIEVDGPQRARLNLEELEAQKKDGAPPTEEPPVEAESGS